MIWSNFLIASLLGPGTGFISSSPAPVLSSGSLYAGTSELGLERVARLSSLGLLVRCGFVVGEEAGEAIRGDGRGC
jgi:hypothetical protein